MSNRIDYLIGNDGITDMTRNPNDLRNTVSALVLLAIAVVLLFVGVAYWNIGG